MNEEERLEELERQRKALKRNRQVPYEEMKKAREHFEEKFPKADKVEPHIYMKRVYCEVWKDGAAEIWFYD